MVTHNKKNKPLRRVSATTITETVSRLCIKANTRLRPDMCRAIETAYKKERSSRARMILAKILENADCARKNKLPLCQDTGMTVVFVEIGQSVHITGGDVQAAIQRGVRDGYKRGYLRTSVVADAIYARRQTGDNTPAVIYFSLIQGDRIKIHVIPKGFGAENKTMLRMLNPTASEKDIIDTVRDVVRKAGPNACPPLVLGVGIGGTADKAMMLAKEALLRPVDKPHHDPAISRLEKKLITALNRLDIGPLGFGGATTVLGVLVETFPTHIAGLPIAVNVSCHATRSASTVV